LLRLLLQNPDWPAAGLNAALLKAFPLFGDLI